MARIASQKRNINRLESLSEQIKDTISGTLLTAFQNKAIRDNELHVSLLDCRQLNREKTILVNSNLNQVATLRVRVKKSPGESGQTIGTASISSGVVVRAITNDYENANQGFIAMAGLSKYWPYLEIGVQCSEAPTSGNITVSVHTPPLGG